VPPVAVRYYRAKLYTKLDTCNSVAMHLIAFGGSLTSGATQDYSAPLPPTSYAGVVHERRTQQLEDHCRDCGTPLARDHAADLFCSACTAARHHYDPRRGPRPMLRMAGLRAGTGRLRPRVGSALPRQPGGLDGAHAPDGVRGTQEASPGEHRLEGRHSDEDQAGLVLHQLRPHHLADQRATTMIATGTFCRQSLTPSAYADSGCRQNPSNAVVIRRHTLRESKTFSFGEESNTRDPVQDRRHVRRSHPSPRGRPATAGPGAGRPLGEG